MTRRGGSAKRWDMSHCQLDLFDPSVTHPIATPRRRGRRNELLEVMRLALVVSRRQLDDYSCPRSRHTFTQPQLLACLVLKALKKLTYRGATELLEASDALRAVLGLGRAPAHTTLLEFSRRVLSPAVIDRGLRVPGPGRRVASRASATRGAARRARR